jgi:hypothetical protein
MFVAVYKPSGSLVTAIREGGATNDWAGSIAVDTKGFIYLTGYYTGTAQFNINGNPIALTSAGNADVYFLKAKRNSLQTPALKNINQSFATNKDSDKIKFSYIKLHLTHSHQPQTLSIISRHLQNCG